MGFGTRNGAAFQTGRRTGIHGVGRGHRRVGGRKEREGVRGKEKRRAEDRKGGVEKTGGREGEGKHGGREKLIGNGGERRKACCNVLGGAGWRLLVETLPVQGAEVTYPIASHP